MSHRGLGVLDERYSSMHIYKRNNNVASDGCEVKSRLVHVNTNKYEPALLLVVVAMAARPYLLTSFGDSNLRSFLSITVNVRTRLNYGGRAVACREHSHTQTRYPSVLSVVCFSLQDTMEEKQDDFADVLNVFYLTSRSTDDALEESLSGELFLFVVTCELMERASHCK